MARLSNPFVWAGELIDNGFSVQDALRKVQSLWVEGTDGAAIHDNVANEIAPITEKVSPVNADLVIIEDSADSNNKKKVQVGNLPSGTGEVNTASSAGTGTSVYYQKSGVDIELNAIKSENSLLSVALDGVSHDVELTVNEGNFTHNNVSSLQGGAAGEYYHLTLAEYNDLAGQQYATEVDETVSYTYIGEAVPGTATSSALWRIKRMEETGPDISILWADGDSDFDNIWDNRLSLSYS